MTTRYVGIGGNNANSGLSWAQRKLTLAGVEATPVEAGDTVYVGPGTYRSASTNPILTCGVDGSSGSPITYVGDYTGANTTGSKGVVRLTTSAADVSYPNTSYMISNAKAYRTFRGFTLDSGYNGACVYIAGDHGVIDECHITMNGLGSAEAGVFVSSAGTNAVVSNCLIHSSNYCIFFWHSDDVDNHGSVISNCVFIPGSNGYGVADANIGGITVRNCYFTGYGGVVITAVPAAGQTVTVNNSLFLRCRSALNGGGAGFLIENYNNFTACYTTRTNVDDGAQSLAYPELSETRWFHEMVNSGTLISPFDLASYSGLINVAGTSPTTADMRGTTVQGTQREWGALEYDSTLDIEAGTGGGGAVSIQPTFGRVSL